MVSQTKVNVNGAQSATEGVRKSVAELVRDLISLGELQWQLLMHDLRDGASRGALSLALIACGAAFALCAVPMLLLAAGWCLVTRAGLSHDVAFLIVSLSCFVVAALVGWIGWRRLHKTLRIFERSGHELSENLAWIKKSLGERPK